MKANLRWLLPLIFWLTLQQSSSGQIVNGKGTGETDQQVALNSGQVLTFTDALANQVNRFEVVITGSPATASISIQGMMPGGTNCGSAVTSASTGNQVLIAFGPCAKWTITTSWTGGSSPTFTYNRLATVNAQQPGAGSSLPVSVAGPTAPGVADASTTNPVQMAGIDPGGLVRKVAVSTGGSLSTALNATGSDGISNGTIGYLLANGNSVIPPSFIFNGTTWDRNFYCSNTTTQTISAATTQLVALVSGKKIRICSYNITRTDSAAVVATLQFVEGTGAACVTGQTNTSGKVAAFASGAVGTVTWAGGNSGAMITTIAGDALCATEVGAASSMDVTITYATPF